MKISIPEEFHAEIKMLNDDLNRALVNTAINTEAFKQAVKKLDAEDAYARKIKEQELGKIHKAAHKALWEGLKKAVPQTSEDNWDFDESGLSVSPSSRNGLSGMFGH